MNNDHNNDTSNINLELKNNNNNQIMMIIIMLTLLIIVTLNTSLTFQN